MRKFRIRGVVLLAGGAILFLCYALRWPPYSAEQLKAEPMLLESHPPGIALLVLLAAIILSTIGLVIFFMDYQKWPKRSGKMSQLRLRGFILLLVGVLLVTYVVIYHPGPTAEEWRAHPMLRESQMASWVGTVFLVGVAASLLGIALTLFDLQRWLKKRQLEKELRKPDQDTM